MPIQVPSSSLGATQASVNGLVLGSGTAYRLMGVTGWYDVTPAPLGGTQQLQPKVMANGSYPLPYFAADRVVTLVIAIEAPRASFADAVAQLARSTLPQIDSNGLPVQIPVIVQLGDPNQQTAYGTVSNRQIPTLAPDFSSGVSIATIEVTCPDPRKFGADVSATTNLPHVSGGVTWPVTWPLSWPGTQDSGSVTVTNPGNTNGPMRLRVDGPCTAPSITHAETGATLTLGTSAGLTVNAGDWLDIDCEARTVLYNGQVSRNGYLTSRGWFAFEPGDNTIGFNAAGYNTTAQLTVTGTPAWI